MMNLEPSTRRRVGAVMALVGFGGATALLAYDSDRRATENSAKAAAESRSRVIASYAISTIGRKVQGREHDPRLLVKADPTVKGGYVLQLAKRIEEDGCDDVERVTASMKKRPPSQYKYPDRFSPTTTYRVSAEIDFCEGDGKYSPPGKRPEDLEFRKDGESWTAHDLSFAAGGRELKDPFDIDFAAGEMQEMYEHIVGK